MSKQFIIQIINNKSVSTQHVMVTNKSPSNSIIQIHVMRSDSLLALVVASTTL